VKMFKYTRAICRKIPRSIIEEGIRMVQNEAPFNYELADKLHDAYMAGLKQAGVQVTLLEADENFPDCVFVEDTAVVIKNKVLITNPGAESRKKEVEAIQKVFEQDENMNVFKMLPPATLDGGDVLFTGKEVFVGLSKRTNMEGFQTLKDFFVEYPVHFVDVANSTLHLKSAMTMVCEDIITCNESLEARAMLKIVQEKAKNEYKVVFVPDDLASNCVLVNGKIICHTMKRFPQSISKFQKLPVELVEIENTEVEKVDGAFTCCSLLY